MPSSHLPPAPGPNGAAPESPEILNLLNNLEAFCRYISGTALQTFEESHDLDADGLTMKELNDYVSQEIKTQITDTLPGFALLVNGASDPEKALNALAATYIRNARGLAETHYRELVNLKKSGTDRLTGLPNRVVFERNLEIGLERNRRLRETFSFAIFDVDHFKNVNDTHGHEAGDQVLQEMARRLKQDVNMRGLDLLFRYGGEEFGAILPNTTKEGACVLARRITEAINGKPFRVSDSRGNTTEINITVSIGISQLTHANEDPEGKMLMRRADESLYVLKGKKPDAIKNIVADRRGRIACDSQVISDEMIAEYRRQMPNGHKGFDRRHEG